MEALVREDGNMVQQLQASQEQVSRLMMNNEALRHKLKVRPVREIIVEKEVLRAPTLTRSRPMIVNKPTAKAGFSRRKKEKRPLPQRHRLERPAENSALLSFSQANVALSATNRALRETQGEYRAVVRSLQERIDTMVEQQELDISQMKESRDKDVAAITANAQQDMQILQQQIDVLQQNVLVLNESHKRLQAENETLQAELKGEKVLLKQARSALREETAACEDMLALQRERLDGERRSLEKERSQLAQARKDTGERMNVLAHALTNRERLVRQLTQEAEIAKARLLFHEERSQEQIQKLQSALEQQQTRAAVLNETLSSKISGGEEKERAETILSLRTELEELQKEREKWMVARRVSKELEKQKKSAMTKDSAMQCEPTITVNAEVQTAKELTLGEGTDKAEGNRSPSAAEISAAADVVERHREREHVLLKRIRDLEDVVNFEKSKVVELARQAAAAQDKAESQKATLESTATVEQELRAQAVTANQRADSAERKLGLLENELKRFWNEDEDSNDDAQLTLHRERKKLIELVNNISEKEDQLERLTAELEQQRESNDELSALYEEAKSKTAISTTHPNVAAGTTVFTKSAAVQLAELEVCLVKKDASLLAAGRAVDKLKKVAQRFKELSSRQQQEITSLKAKALEFRKVLGEKEGKVTALEALLERRSSNFKVALGNANHERRELEQIMHGRRERGRATLESKLAIAEAQAERATVEAQRQTERLAAVISERDGIATECERLRHQMRSMTRKTAELLRMRAHKRELSRSLQRE